MVQDVDHCAGHGKVEPAGGRVEMERRARTDVELTGEVARHEYPRAGADRGERRVRIAGRELEVGLAREGARIERVDADPYACVDMLGEPHALDPLDAGHRGQPLA